MLSFLFNLNVDNIPNTVEPAPQVATVQEKINGSSLFNSFRSQYLAEAVSNVNETMLDKKEAQEIIKSLEGAKITPIAFKQNGNSSCNGVLFETLNGHRYFFTIKHCGWQNGNGNKSWINLPYRVLSNIPKVGKSKNLKDDGLIIYDWDQFKDFFAKRPEHKLAYPETKLTPKFLDSPYSNNCEPVNDMIGNFSARDFKKFRYAELHSFLLLSKLYDQGDSGSAWLQEGLIRETKKPCTNILGFVTRGKKKLTKIEDLIAQNVLEIELGIKKGDLLTPESERRINKITGVTAAKKYDYSYPALDTILELPKEKLPKYLKILSEILKTNSDQKSILFKLNDPVPISLIEKINNALKINNFDDFIIDTESMRLESIYMMVIEKYESEIEAIVRTKYKWPSFKVNDIFTITENGYLSRVSSADNDLVKIFKISNIQLVTQVINDKLVIIDVILPTYTIDGKPLLPSKN
jgi:hypothetical protein